MLRGARAEGIGGAWAWLGPPWAGCLRLVGWSRCWADCALLVPTCRWTRLAPECGEDIWCCPRPDQIWPLGESRSRGLLHVGGGPTFHSDLEQELLPYVGIPIIWAGDFNCVLDGCLDRSPLKQGNKPHMAARLQETMDRLHFVDVWLTGAQNECLERDIQLEVLQAAL
ncbi:hypothetical protein NDU88_006882 [Pleurodeles waltl]|uniref:Endonuclease/exonuclease/phosphatase domain-containing protein n=1 Tax=Pleurodeles waltl TaxID=8319 RepID=A0AAV7UMB8_PLEWA|nr:hypothetical protein NDU88_006882 [Pleurodeles waltl]